MTEETEKRRAPRSAIRQEVTISSASAGGGAAQPAISFDVSAAGASLITAAAWPLDARVRLELPGGGGQAEARVVRCARRDSGDYLVGIEFTGAGLRWPAARGAGGRG